jgi:protein O-GlcNAc transferase
MPSPKWIKDHTWQWAIGILIAIMAIIIPLILSSPKPPSQSIQSNGDNNVNVQVDRSPGAVVQINKMDPEELARQVVEKLPHVNALKDKENEINSLKATIARLQKAPGDEFKQAALKALSEGDTIKATELLEKAAQTRSKEARQLTREASQDWVDIGNIAYLTDSQKALKAYQKAIDLDPENPYAWNGLVLMFFRLGCLDKAQEAYEQTLALAGDDKFILALCYGNMGLVYRTQGDLDKALEVYEKALEIYKELGYKEGVAANYGNMGNVYRTRGDLDKALEIHGKSLEIDKELGRKEGMAKAYGNMGFVYRTRGDLDKAEKVWTTSLQLFKAISAKDKIELVQGLLADLRKQ